MSIRAMACSHGAISRIPSSLPPASVRTEVVSGSGEPLLSLWGADGTVWAVGYGNSVLVHRP